MGDVSIMEEKPVSMTEVKAALDKEAKNGELNFRAKKTLEYLNAFVKLKQKEAKEVHGKIEALNIPRLKDKNIIKIIDIMPKDLDSLKILFANENITVKQDDIKKIFEVIK